MAYLDRGSFILVAFSAVLAGCSDNPWFYIESDGGPHGTTTSGGGSSGGTSGTDATDETSGGVGTTTDPPPTTGAESGETGSASVPVTSTAPDTGMSSETEPDPDTGSETLETTGGVGDLCGNGILDPGEECDDGGESAMCDDDCTAVQCNDGNLNEAAQEACDDGNDSEEDGCLTTCIPASCGDQHVWEGVETCDAGPGEEGNGTEAGGCNVDCDGLVAEKPLKLIAAPTLLYGHMSPSEPPYGLDGADLACEIKVGAGYVAMVSDGMERIASNTAWKGDGSD